jgi:PAS domain
LQSTNEELETSREEIQSINEELNTVNAQLYAKVEQLDRSNGDLRNLSESTEVATAFLDPFLIIRSFTPEIAGIYNVIPTDADRPLNRHRQPDGPPVTSLVVVVSARRARQRSVSCQRVWSRRWSSRCLTSKRACRRGMSEATLLCGTSKARKYYNVHP